MSRIMQIRYLSFDLPLLQKLASTVTRGAVDITKNTYINPTIEGGARGMNMYLSETLLSRVRTVHRPRRYLSLYFVFTPGVTLV